MTLREYQMYSRIDSGATNYEELVIEHFKLDKNQKISEIKEQLRDILTIKPIEIKEKNKIIKINGKRFVIEKDLLDCTYEQFARMDSLMQEPNHIDVLHKLIAIYCRPFNFKRFNIEKWDINKQDEIAEQFLDVDMNTIHGLIFFFYQCAIKCMLNMNIYYLNQMKKSQNQASIKNK